jgi:PAS domain S-box-containing protein
MSVLRNMTIKYKLISIIMLTCITALLLAGGAFIGWEQKALRNSMLQNVSTQTEMIAENCKAALAFQDTEDAKETLTALHVEPSIVFGCVYAKDNKLFATYYRDYPEIKVHPSKFQKRGFHFGDGFLTVFRPIVLDGEVIGTVCLQSDLTPMYVMLKRNITVIIVVLSLVSLVAYFVSSRLQGVVSEPIFKLAESATKIGKGELSHRVKIQSKNELGLLAASFNNMASKLKESYTDLEQKVKERTAANTKLKEEIAERKKAEQALRVSTEQWQNTFNAIRDGVFLLDAESKILQYNKAMAKLLRKPCSQIIGRPCYEVVHGTSEPIEECPFVRTKATKRRENIVLQMNGRWFDSIIDPLLDDSGNLIGAAHILADITERKEAEQKLQALNRDLIATAKKLEESNRQLKDFVYIASHDLREPLRKISSFGGLLQNSLGGSLAKDDLENLNFMIDGAKRMSQMIEGLLAYSRINTQEVPFEVVDLNEIVEQLQQLELAEALEETGGTIEIPQLLPKVQSNPIQIRQLLQNIIVNGIKYRRDQVRPQMVIRAKQIDNDKVRIEVQDNGIGIKPEYHNDIFTMFRRLHSRRKYDGTGIGLAVCKKIVEKHKGQIGVESKYGEGSTFWFTLSVANEAIAANEAVRAM